MTIKERDVIFQASKLLPKQWVGFISTVVRCALSFEKQSSHGRLEFYTALFSFWLFLWLALFQGDGLIFVFLRVFRWLDYSCLKNLALGFFFNKFG